MVSLSLMVDIVFITVGIVIFTAGFWSGRKVERFVKKS